MSNIDPFETITPDPSVANTTQHDPSTVATPITINYEPVGRVVSQSRHAFGNIGNMMPSIDPKMLGLGAVILVGTALNFNSIKTQIENDNEIRRHAAAVSHEQRTASVNRDLDAQENDELAVIAHDRFANKAVPVYWKETVDETSAVFTDATVRYGEPVLDGETGVPLPAGTIVADKYMMSATLRVTPDSDNIPVMVELARLQPTHVDEETGESSLQVYNSWYAHWSEFYGDETKPQPIQLQN